MSVGYVLSFIRAINPGLKLSPKDRPLGSRFSEREMRPPMGSPGTPGYYQQLNVGEKIEIGNNAHESWTIDGGPMIKTPDGRNVFGLSVHETLLAYHGHNMPKNLEDLTRRTVLLARGEIRTPAQKICGVDSVEEREIKPGEKVEFLVGKTLDGRDCYIRVECVAPRQV